MGDDLFNLNNSGKIISKSATRDEALIEIELRNEGYNLDLVEMYQWHLNFPYYTGKGYIPLKLEDYHYFSENSQHGQGIRQVKGGSIRAFQENLRELIQLVKVNMMPLLKEIKEAHFYKKWFDKIVENDKIVQYLLKKGMTNENEKLKKARLERNEAVNHIKDKWVNEVDGGKMWQMNKSASEQGLDFVLLPQLFFGINLDNPLAEYHNTGRTIKEQLDDDIYSVDITEDAKLGVGRFMFRFHTWLPTAIKDTNITFKLKISTLKQFYAQLQMYIDFMKPLLIEISKKSERFESSNFYRDFEIENPEFSNLFDTSYSFIKILGLRDFGLKERGQPWIIEDLEFTKFGLYLKTKKDILFGIAKGKTGFIKSEKEGKYEFYQTSNKDISKEEFEKIEPIIINKNDLNPFPIMEFDFSQKRRNEIVQTQQGAQQIPYMRNSIIYRGYCWNLFEIATYRNNLKKDNIELLETFIGEIKIIKDDLLYYVNDLEDIDDSIDYSPKSIDENFENKNENSDENFSLILGPFQALGNILSPLIPNLNLKNKETKIDLLSSESKEKYNIMRIQICEDVWNLYTIHKKTHGFMQY